MPRTSYAIALGSNRRHGRHGRPEHVIVAALDALRSAGVAVGHVSPIIPTAAVGQAGRRFANTTAIVETALAPPALLALLKRIEREFGRRNGRRWGARVLDLDILLWSGGSWPISPSSIDHRHLVVPHRSLTERRFVLDPLVHIAPDWRHPGSGHTVRQMHHRLLRRSPRG